MESVRRANAKDAPQLAVLAGELGYPATEDEVRRRLEELAWRAEHVVFVYEDARGVHGFVHAELVHGLVSSTFVEIASLVVAERERGRGLGVALLSRAEAWARELGVGCVRLRSRSTRERAHAFYRRAGYAVVKTQLAFERALEPRTEEGRR